MKRRRFIAVATAAVAGAPFCAVSSALAQAGGSGEPTYTATFAS